MALELKADAAPGRALTLYHVTTVPIAKKIKAEGFKPVDQGMWKNYYAPQGRDGIYFYDDLKYSEAYAAYAEGQLFTQAVQPNRSWAESKKHLPQMAIIEVQVPENIVQTTDQKEDGFFVPSADLSKVHIKSVYRYDYVPTQGRHPGEKLAYATPGQYIYHVTYIKNLDNIASSGLTPNAESGIGGPALAGHKAGKVFLTDAGGVSFWLNRAEQFAYHNSDNPGEDGLVPVVLRMREQADWKLKLDDVGTDDSGSEAFSYAGSLNPDDLEAWDGTAWVSIYSASLDPMNYVDEEGYLQDTLNSPKLATSYGSESDGVPEHGMKGVGGQAYPRLRRTPMFEDEALEEGQLKNARAAEESFPIPAYLYHGTDKKNLDDILKNGLRVEFNESNIEWQKATYLACDQTTAASYAGHKGVKPENWVILQIEVSKLHKDLLRPDDYDFRDIWEMYSGDIEPWVKEEYGTNWALVPWEVSLKYSCQVAYLGDIPPVAMKVIPTPKIGSAKTADGASYWEGMEQAANSILQEFEQHIKEPEYRQKWQVVPAARVKKIWNDYAKTGMVRDEKGMDDIAWTILYNIWKIHANTIFCGHTDQNQYDFAESVTGENFLEKYGKDKWDNGCFDWDSSFFEDDNGQWRLTDFALDKLVNAAIKLEDAKTAEQKLAAVDMVFNIVHARSDLPSWFIQGGTTTLNSLAGYEKVKTSAALPGFEAWLKANGGIGKVLDSYDVNEADTYGYGLEEPDPKNKAAVKRYEKALRARAIEDFRERFENFRAEHQSWTFPMDVYRCISLPKGDKPSTGISGKPKGQAPQQQHLFPGTPAAEFQQALQAIQYQGVGIYWSWEENAAECHWGSGGSSITLHGRIQANNVDWDGTMYANIYPGLGEEEKEVRLIEGTQFELVGIQYEDNGKWQQPPVNMVTASSAPKRKILYHATSADNINSIAKFGLKPSEKPNWGGSLGDQSRGRVFFAKTPASAMYYASIVFRDRLEDYGEAYIPLCLRVRIPDTVQVEVGEASNVSKGVYMTDTKVMAPYEEAWATQDVPPDAIEIYWHDEWQPLKTSSYWGEMAIRFNEDESYYEDWEGAPVGESVTEAVNDVHNFTLPKTAKENVSGQVYLLHFDIQPDQIVPTTRPDAYTKTFHARHYLGWALVAQDRIDEHYKNQSGVKLIDAVHNAGITFTVARVWDDVTREFERKLKNQGGLSRHCPICKKLGLDRDSLYKKRLQTKETETQVAPATPEEGPDFVEKEKIEQA